MAESFNPSEELRAVLQRLSAQQSDGVLRIVAAELTGLSLERLFEGEDKICSRSTFMSRKRGGWKFKPDFQMALALARSEYRAFKLGSVVDDALDELRLTTPLAAQDLRRQITGDVDAVAVLQMAAVEPTLDVIQRGKAIEALGEIGTLAASAALVELLDEVDPVLRADVFEAIGHCAHGLSSARRLASVAVLDRASELTADKGSGQGVEALSDDELASIVARGSSGAGTFEP